MTETTLDKARNTQNSKSVHARDESEEVFGKNAKKKIFHSHGNAPDEMKDLKITENGEGIYTRQLIYLIAGELLLRTAEVSVGKQ